MVDTVVRPAKLLKSTFANVDETLQNMFETFGKPGQTFNTCLNCIPKVKQMSEMFWGRLGPGCLEPLACHDGGFRLQRTHVASKGTVQRGIACAG